MKIETIAPSQKNITVKFSNNIRVSFVNGVGEVSEEDGEYLLDKYSEYLFPEGKVVLPKPAAPTKNLPVDGSEVESLRAKLQLANGLVNDYKAQIGAAKENERVWRNKCQELMLENHTLRDQLSAGRPIKEDKTDKTNVPDNTSKPDDTEAIRAKLLGKSVKELTTIVEGMKLPVEEYKMLNKNKLVDYIIGKTTNVTT
jgi:regulator of replication initiation timing